MEKEKIKEKENDDDVFIHLSVTDLRSTHEGHYGGLFTEGKTLRGDDPLKVAQAPWALLHDLVLLAVKNAFVVDTAVRWPAKIDTIPSTK